MLQVQIQEISIRSQSRNRSILKDVFFDLGRNQVFTVLGKNGSGKSTFIKSVTGLLDNKFYSVSGSVLFKGKDLLALKNEKLLEIRRDKIKYVFQDAVNSFDHLKKLKYYFDLLTKDKNEVNDLLEYFLLAGSKQLFEMYAYELSGGMAQRVSFVLALLSKPEIIILDEPTSGIDSAIANLFLLKLKDFAKSNENSVLLVTQDILFAEKVSDKIAYLSNSRLSEFYEAGEFFNALNDPQLNEFLQANKQIESPTSSGEKWAL